MDTVQQARFDFPEKRKSKLDALLLCFFLGFLGAHRLYLGYTAIGLLQLFTFGGFGLWAFIDLILIAVGKVKDSKGNALADIPLKESAVFRPLAFGFVGLCIVIILLSTFSKKEQTSTPVGTTSDPASSASVEAKTTEPEPIKSITSTQERGGKNYAWYAVKKYVEKRLKKPETADFPFADFNALESVDGGWVITSYVESENDYGTEVKYRFIAKVKLSRGGTESLWTDWELLDLQFFNAP